MSVKVDEYTVVIRAGRDSDIEVRVPLDELFEALDDEGLDMIVEFVTRGRVLDKAVERLCGDALLYECPTDSRRAHEVLLAMEERVLGSNLWGSFNETERAIRESILQDDRRYAGLPYETRRRLIDIAHGRARRLRKVVHAEMAKLRRELRGEEVAP